MMTRWMSVAVAVGSGAVLGLAALLEPSPAGHGTHTQLGLGSCSFLSATGVPCPMCGATTSFSLMAHLRPLDAVVNQPFATLLFLLTASVFAVALVEIVDPRDRWQRLYRWVGPREGFLALAFLVFMGLGWAYKAWQMGAAG